ncbi:PREDICTED: odorant receptor 82a-like isoform X2 [Vollenhovia emeryi]|uniref:odorant receptor 82a-like isoform X2 n=1 Tax=Vollenhovia emeryi TaxID=411798 RepID=UPI0005F49411|nr:PREDICTED: odorant receptor 82a-like isoform X2 [Vollenhovia emeryi]
MEDDSADSISVSTSTHLVDKHNEYSIQVIRWILKMINVWPQPADMSIIEKIRSDFAIFVCYFLIIVIMVPNAMVNYSFLLMHVGDIQDCVDHVKTDWHMIRRLEDRTVMLKSAKLGRFIAGFCAVFMQSGVFSYNIVTSLSKSVLHMGNSSMMVRTLPYPVYKKILNTYLSPTYELVFILQCLSSFVVTCVTAATCGLAAVFVMHACGQMKIMISWLKDLMDDRSEEKTSGQKFAIIVNHHLRILSFISRTEKIMNIICLVELFGCTMHICFLGYYCIMDYINDNKKSILSHSMVLSSITFNIFIFCYIGEILSEQGEQIGKSAYMTNWYLLRGKTAQGLILIILRSNAGVKLTAGKIVQLSFSTFGDVIKSALAYLNILRTVMLT